VKIVGEKTQGDGVILFSAEWLNSKPERLKLYIPPQKNI
jgi:hypothetical protein